MKSFLFSSSKLFRRVARPAGTAALALAYLLTNVAGLYAAEGNFWKERRVAARAQTGNMLLAGLPAAAPTPYFPTPGSTPSRPASSVAVKLPKGTRALLGPWAERVAAYGEIREAYAPTGAKGPVIIHIQDAHEIEEAQRNIASMVEELNKGGATLVGLEGAAGAFDFSLFKDIPDREVSSWVADEVLKLGYIGGAELAAIRSEKTPLLWGIENPDSYIANVDALHGSEKARPAAQADLGRLEAALEKLKDGAYPAELRNWDRRLQAHARGDDSLTDYLTFLTGDLKLDLLGYPNLNKLSQSLAREKSLDFSAVERERQLLAKSLAPKLSRPEMEDLIQRSLDLRSGRLSTAVYYEHLSTLCRAKGVPFQSNLKAYVDYLVLAESIVHEGIFDEMAKLEETLPVTFISLPPRGGRSPATLPARAVGGPGRGGASAGAIVSSSQILQIAGADRLAGALKKLIANEQTPLDWKRFQSRRVELTALPKSLASLGSPAGAQAAAALLAEGRLAPFENFSQFAETRNAALVENLMMKLTAEVFPQSQKSLPPPLRGSPNAGLPPPLRGRAGEGGAPQPNAKQPPPPAAILIAGGFHTEGIKVLLKSRGAAYLVVSPRMTAVPQGHSPVHAFVRAPLPLEELLAGDTVNVAFTRLLQTDGQMSTAAPSAPVRSEVMRTLVAAGAGLLLLAKGQSLDAVQNWFSKHPSLTLSHLSVGKTSLPVIHATAAKTGARGLTYILVPQDQPDFLTQAGINEKPKWLSSTPFTGRYDLMAFDGNIAGVRPGMSMAQFGRATAALIAYVVRAVRDGANDFVEVAALRLKGGGHSEVEAEAINAAIKGAINNERAWKLMGMPTSQTGDRDLPEFDGEKEGVGAKFLEDLRVAWKAKSADQDEKSFSLVVVDAELPHDAVLHPAFRRSGAYWPLGYLLELSSVYQKLDEADRVALMTMITEALAHEAGHLRKGRETSEHFVESEFPSLRARELFKLIQAELTHSGSGEWKAFLQQPTGPRFSFLKAYPNATPEVHLMMAEKLLKNQNLSESILARDHIGFALAQSPDSDSIQTTAVELLDLPGALPVFGDEDEPTARSFAQLLKDRWTVRPGDGSVPDFQPHGFDDTDFVDEERFLARVNSWDKPVWNFLHSVRSVYDSKNPYLVAAASSKLPRARRLLVLEMLIDYEDHHHAALKASDQFRRLMHGMQTDEKQDDFLNFIAKAYQWENVNPRHIEIGLNSLENFVDKKHGVDGSPAFAVRFSVPSKGFSQNAFNQTSLDSNSVVFEINPTLLADDLSQLNNLVRTVGFHLRGAYGSEFAENWVAEASRLLDLPSAVTSPPRGGLIPSLTRKMEPRFQILFGDRWGTAVNRVLAQPLVEEIRVFFLPGVVLAVGSITGFDTDLLVAAMLGTWTVTRAFFQFLHPGRLDNQAWGVTLPSLFFIVSGLFSHLLLGLDPFTVAQWVLSASFLAHSAVNAFHLGGGRAWVLAVLGGVFTVLGGLLLVWDGSVLASVFDGSLSVVGLFPVLSVAGTTSLLPWRGLTSPGLDVRKIPVKPAPDLHLLAQQHKRLLQDFLANPSLSSLHGVLRELLETMEGLERHHGLGVFKAYRLHNGKYAIAFGIPAEEGQDPRIGVGDLVLDSHSLLNEHAHEILLHQLSQVRYGAPGKSAPLAEALGANPTESVHTLSLRLGAALFWGEDVRHVPAEGLKRHPANHLGAALQTWGVEADLARLLSLKDRLEGASGETVTAREKVERGWKMFESLLVDVVRRVEQLPNGLSERWQQTMSLLRVPSLDVPLGLQALVPGELTVWRPLQKEALDFALLHFATAEQTPVFLAERSNEHSLVYQIPVPSLEEGGEPAFLTVRFSLRHPAQMPGLYRVGDPRGPPNDVEHPITLCREAFRVDTSSLKPGLRTVLHTAVKLASGRDLTEVESAAYEKVRQKARMTRWTRKSWLQQHAPELLSYSAFSRAMESIFNRTLAERLNERFGFDLLRFISQSNMTGGLGHVIFDYHVGLAQDGLDVATVVPLWNDIKGVVRHTEGRGDGSVEMAPGLPSLPAGFSTMGDMVRAVSQRIELGIPPFQLPQDARFKSWVDSQGLEKAQFLLGRDILTDIYVIPDMFTGFPIIYPDAYVMDGDRKRHIFDEVYSDPAEGPWRAVQAAVFSVSFQLLTRRLVTLGYARKKIVVLEHELFSQMPDTRLEKDIEDGTLSELVRHVFNHTVFRPGLYDIPMPAAGILYLDGRPDLTVNKGWADFIYLAGSANEKSDRISGVSLPHQRVLERDLFPEWAHKIFGHFNPRKADEGLNSANGVLLEHWQGPEIRRLIDQAKGILADRGVEFLRQAEGDPFTDKAFYALLDEPEHADIAADFRARLAMVKALYNLDFLLLLHRTQKQPLGGGQWLAEDLAHPSLGGRYTLENIQAHRDRLSFLINWGFHDESAWLRVRNQYGPLLDSLLSWGYASNVRRQVSYKGPDMYERMLTGFQGPDMAHQLAQFKSARTRLVFGGRMFGSDASNRFDGMKGLASSLGLNNIAFLENYNSEDARIIFKVASDVMLSDEKLEAAATSNSKVLPNGGWLIGVYDGANPERWMVFDTRPQQTQPGGEPFTYRGRPGMIRLAINYQGEGVTQEQAHDILRQGIRDGTIKILNGRLVGYSEEKSSIQGGGRRPEVRDLVDSLLELGKVFEQPLVEREFFLAENIRWSYTADIRRQTRAMMDTERAAVNDAVRVKTVVDQVWAGASDEILEQFEGFLFGQKEKKGFEWHYLKHRQSEEKIDLGVPSEQGWAAFQRDLRLIRARFQEGGRPGIRGGMGLWSLRYHVFDNGRNDLKLYLVSLLKDKPALAPLLELIEQSMGEGKPGEVYDDETTDRLVYQNLQALELIARVVDGVERRIRGRMINEGREEVLKAFAGMSPPHRSAALEKVKNGDYGFQWKLGEYEIYRQTGANLRHLRDDLEGLLVETTRGIDSLVYMSGGRRGGYLLGAKLTALWAGHPVLLGLLEGLIGEMETLRSGGTWGTSVGKRELGFIYQKLMGVFDGLTVQIEQWEPASMFSTPALRRQYVETWLSERSPEEASAVTLEAMNPLIQLFERLGRDIGPASDREKLLLRQEVAEHYLKVENTVDVLQERLKSEGRRDQAEELALRLNKAMAAAPSLPPPVGLLPVWDDVIDGLRGKLSDRMIAGVLGFAEEGILSLAMLGVLAFGMEPVTAAMSMGFLFALLHYKVRRLEGGRITKAEKTTRADYVKLFVGGTALRLTQIGLLYFLGGWFAPELLAFFGFSPAAAPPLSVLSLTSTCLCVTVNPIVSAVLFASVILPAVLHGLILNYRPDWVWKWIPAVTRWPLFSMSFWMPETGKPYAEAIENHVQKGDRVLVVGSVEMAKLYAQRGARVDIMAVYPKLIELQLERARKETPEYFESIEANGGDISIVRNTEKGEVFDHVCLVDDVTYYDSKAERNERLKKILGQLKPGGKVFWANHDETGETALQALQDRLGAGRGATLLDEGFPPPSGSIGKWFLFGLDWGKKFSETLTRRIDSAKGFLPVYLDMDKTAIERVPGGREEMLSVGMADAILDLAQLGVPVPLVTAAGPERVLRQFAEPLAVRAKNRGLTHVLPLIPLATANGNAVLEYLNEGYQVTESRDLFSRALAQFNLAGTAEQRGILLETFEKAVSRVVNDINRTTLDLFLRALAQFNLAGTAEQRGNLLETFEKAVPRVVNDINSTTLVDEGVAQITWSLQETLAKNDIGLAVVTGFSPDSLTAAGTDMNAIALKLESEVNKSVREKLFEMVEGNIAKKRVTDFFRQKPLFRFHQAGQTTINGMLLGDGKAHAVRKLRELLKGVIKAQAEPGVMMDDQFDTQTVAEAALDSAVAVAVNTSSRMVPAQGGLVSKLVWSPRIGVPGTLQGLREIVEEVRRHPAMRLKGLLVELGLLARARGGFSAEIRPDADWARVENLIQGEMRTAAERFLAAKENANTTDRHNIEFHQAALAEEAEWRNLVVLFNEGLIAAAGSHEAYARHFADWARRVAPKLVTRNSLAIFPSVPHAAPSEVSAPAPQIKADQNKRAVLAVRRVRKTDPKTRREVEWLEFRNPSGRVKREESQEMGQIVLMRAGEQGKGRHWIKGEPGAPWNLEVEKLADVLIRLDDRLDEAWSRVAGMGLGVTQDVLLDILHDLLEDGKFRTVEFVVSNLETLARAYARDNGEPLFGRGAREGDASGNNFINFGAFVESLGAQGLSAVIDESVLKETLSKGEPWMDIHRLLILPTVAQVGKAMEQSKSGKPVVVRFDVELCPPLQMIPYVGVARPRERVRIDLNALKPASKQDIVSMGLLDRETWNALTATDEIKGKVLDAYWPEPGSISLTNQVLRGFSMWMRGPKEKGFASPFFLAVVASFIGAGVVIAATGATLFGLWAMASLLVVGGLLVSLYGPGAGWTPAVIWASLQDGEIRRAFRSLKGAEGEGLTEAYANLCRLVWERPLLLSTPRLRAVLQSRAADVVVAKVIDQAAQTHPSLLQSTIIAYGSYGRREMSQGSDFDLRVVYPSEVPKEERENALKALNGALWPAVLRARGMETPATTMTEAFLESNWMASSDTETGMEEGLNKFDPLTWRIFIGGRPVGKSSREGFRKMFAHFKEQVRNGNWRHAARNMILERNKAYQSTYASEAVDYKAGIGGIQEWQYMNEIARLVRMDDTPLGWLPLPLWLFVSGRMSLVSWVRLSRAFERQRARRQAGAFLKEDKDRYVADAVLLFDCLSNCARNLWREVKNSDDLRELPLFVGRQRWTKTDRMRDLKRRRGLGESDSPVLIEEDASNGIFHVSILSDDDEPGLLAAISGVLASYGLSIDAADGMPMGKGAFDRFWVRPSARGASFSSINLERDLKRVLESKGVETRMGIVRELFDRNRYSFESRKAPGGRKVPSIVSFPSNQILRVHTSERFGPGLLHVLSRWLAEKNLNVEQPVVRTQGLTGIYEFGGVTRKGRALSSRERKSLQAQLEAFLSLGKIREEDFPARGSTVTGDVEFVADLGGNLNSARRILKARGFLGADGRWGGGDRSLVFMGDVIGRAGDSTEAYEFVRKLQDEALSAGGRVYLVLGNHEMLLAVGRPASNDLFKSEAARADLQRRLAADMAEGRWTAGLIHIDTEGRRSEVHHGGLDQSRYGSLSGLPGWEEWVRSGREDRSDPLRDFTHFINGVGQRIGRELEDQKTEDVVRRHNAFVGSSGFFLTRMGGLMSRVAEFRDDGLMRGLRQVIAHTEGSRVRTQDEDGLVTNVAAGLEGGNAVSYFLDAQGNGRQFAVTSFGALAVSTVEPEGRAPVPLNAAARLLSLAERARLWFSPVSWLKDRAQAADNVQDLMFAYAAYQARVEGWALRSFAASQRLRKMGFEVALEALKNRVGTEPIDPGMRAAWEQGVERDLERLVSYWEKAGLNDSVGPLLFALNGTRIQGKALTGEPTKSGRLGVDVHIAQRGNVQVPHVFALKIRVPSDEPGVLAAITASLAAQGLFIVAARLGTEGKDTVDQFWVKPLHEKRTAQGIKEVTENHLAELLHQANPRQPEELFRELQRPYAFKKASASGHVPTGVRFDEGVLRLYTAERDQPGLLHLISRFMAERDISIVSSPLPIRTLGLSIQDEFKISRRDGSALTQKEGEALAGDLASFLDKDEIAESDFKKPEERRQGGASLGAGGIGGAGGRPRWESADGRRSGEAAGAVETLGELILGGEARRAVPLARFDLNSGEVRRELLANRQEAEDARNRLLNRLNDAGATWREGKAGGALAALHKKQGGSAEAMAEDLRALALWEASRVASDQGDNAVQAKNAHLVQKTLRAVFDAYNREMGVYAAAEMAVAPARSNRGATTEGVRKALMLPPLEVFQGESKASDQDLTVLEQLRSLNNLAQAEDRKDSGKIVLITQGSPEGYQRLLAGRFPDLMAQGAVEVSPLEMFGVEGSRDYAVAKVAERFAGLPFDMFVYDASRWDMAGVDTALVRLLLLAAGNLVVDVTQGISEEIQALAHVRTNA